MHVRKSESILVLLMHVCLTAAVHIVGLATAAAASDTGVPGALQLTSGRHDATHWAVAHFEVAAFVDLINAGSVHQLRTCVCAQGMAQRPERFAALCAEVASILDKSPSFTRQIISLDGPAKAFPVPCDKAVELLITQRLQSQFPEMRQALSLLGPKNREGNSKMTEGVVSLANAPMLISPNPQHPVLQSLFDLTLRPAKLQPLNAQELDDALETYRSESTTLCSRYFGSANGQQRLAQAKRWFAGDLTTVSVCSFIVNGTTPDGADNLTAQVLLSPLTDPYYRWAGAHRENEFTEKQRQDDAKLGFREKHRRDYTNLANRNPLLLLVSSANP